MDKKTFLSLKGRSQSKLDYSYLVIGEVVEVPLLGRDPSTAQKTLLCHAKRKGWTIKTRLFGNKVYALREA